LPACSRGVDAFDGTVLPRSVARNTVISRFAIVSTTGASRSVLAIMSSTASGETPWKTFLRATPSAPTSAVVSTTRQRLHTGSHVPSRASKSATTTPRACDERA
jgi:hypothetical protein